jgi:multisubunit Na+/H+ antiporter MnhB subunit
MSFREKSAWISIVAIGLVYGFYGLQLLHHAPTRLGFAAMLVGSIMLTIMVSIVGHVAVARRREKPDERDRLIDARSTRFGYHAMAVGVWGLIFLALTGPPPALLAYAALGAFVLA